MLKFEDKDIIFNMVLEYDMHDQLLIDEIQELN